MKTSQSRQKHHRREFKRRRKTLPGFPWGDEPLFKERDFPERKACRRKQNFLIYRKWQRKDYEAILARVQAQQRAVSDVCQDPDLPGSAAWRSFIKQHPELDQRLKQIYASWPYFVQSAVLCELSPQFTADCWRLRAQGLTYKQIAERLDVHGSAVIRHLKKTRKS